jgi:thiol:disulfide interchange protein
MKLTPRVCRIALLVVLLVLGGAGYAGYFTWQGMVGRQALAGTQLVSTSLASALERAGRENKRVLVEVAAIWCPSCHRLDRELFTHPEVRRRITNDLVFARLEHDSVEGKAFQARVGARGFPTLWLVESDGQGIKRLDLTFEPGSFLAQLEANGLQK